MWYYRELSLVRQTLWLLRYKSERQRWNKFGRSLTLIEESSHSLVVGANQGVILKKNIHGNLFNRRVLEERTHVI